MIDSYVKRILQARVYDVVSETSLDMMRRMSERLDHNVLIKREDQQSVFSFKIRGAYNRMVRLTDEEKACGVVAASAGNHAQGVALAAASLGIDACIVMPRTTPDIKVESVRARGAQVVLHGDTFDAACTHARALEEQDGSCFIHPFDDPDVIAGQGTIGMEILHQYPQDIDVIFVPVGGGGLAAGISAYCKYVRPDIRVIGVEAEDSACLAAAMAAGAPVTLPEVGIFADGVAVARIGDETFSVCQQTIDEVITVSTDEICAAVKDIFDDTRSIAEPAGALSLAGLKKYAEQETVESQTLICIESGANTNFDRLRHISERAEIGEQKEIVLAVIIPEQPGAFRSFCQCIGSRNVTEFNYRYAGEDEAHIFVGIQCPRSEKQSLLKNLSNNGYTVSDLTDNELAKLHIRHMVGGSTQLPGAEMLFRFEFPERPAALMDFLTAMKHNWSITLFHYRNHGAAFGRVFMGLLVPAGEEGEVKAFLDNVGYHYYQEDNNEAYHLFLK